MAQSIRVSGNVVRTFAWLLALCIFLLALRESGVKWVEDFVSWFPLQLFSAVIGIANIFVTTSFARQQVDKKDVRTIIDDKKEDDELNEGIKRQSTF